MWKQLEPTSAHLTYVILASFLISYALFSQFIRNRLHLSEPPLAVLMGIIFGPRGLGTLDPMKWGFDDELTQEATRIIVGIQCFCVGIELPKHYFAKHWRSVAMLLGPVMTFGWVICTAFTMLVLKADLLTAGVIAACLTPTDPVLAASVLSGSQFAERVPKRIKYMLSAESGCNDGVSFPFLYVGLSVLTAATAGGAVKEWFLVTILWQCALGSIIGLVIGTAFNRVLRFSAARKFIGAPSFFVFYLLLAVFAIGVASTLGVDDFLVAFFAGVGFAHDGWFSAKTKEAKLPNIIDLMLNSSMFVYFGSIIPWDSFNESWTSRTGAEHITVSPGRLFGLLALILLFRRIPAVIALKRWIPDIKTMREAWFCGHFGPMGLGGLFLAIEARAQLETGTSLPLPQPPAKGHHQPGIQMVFPVISFIVLGSTMVHGLSVAAISIGSHFKRYEEERAPLIGGEVEPLEGMVHDTGGHSDESEVSDVGED